MRWSSALRRRLGLALGSVDHALDTRITHIGCGSRVEGEQLGRVIAVAPRTIEPVERHTCTSPVTALGGRRHRRGRAGELAREPGGHTSLLSGAPTWTQVDLGWTSAGLGSQTRITHRGQGGAICTKSRAGVPDLA